MSNVTLNATEIAELFATFATVKNLVVYGAFPSSTRAVPTRDTEDLANQLRTAASYSEFLRSMEITDLNRKLRPVANIMACPVASNLAQTIPIRI